MFWPLKSSSELSRVPEDSKFPPLGVWVSSSHLAQSGVATIRTWPYLTLPWVTWCPNTLFCLILLLTFYFLGDIPFHPLPLLLKWTKLWTWTSQPLGLGSSQKGLFYLGGLCPWPWRTCPLHNIETPYNMHTHEVTITNLRWDNLMLGTLCISSGNLMLL